MAEIEAVAARGKAFLTEFQTLRVHFGDNEEEEGEDRSGSWLDSNENVVH